MQSIKMNNNYSLFYSSHIMVAYSRRHSLSCSKWVFFWLPRLIPLNSAKLTSLYRRPCIWWVFQREEWEERSQYNKRKKNLCFYALFLSLSAFLPFHIYDSHKRGPPKNSNNSCIMPSCDHLFLNPYLDINKNHVRACKIWVISLILWVHTVQYQVDHCLGLSFRYLLVTV